jgi:hypothetical protein
MCLTLLALPLRGQQVDLGDTLPLAAPIPSDTAVAEPAREFVTPWRGLRRELLSSSTPIRVALGAGVDQLQDAPVEWHPTLDGFSRRSGVRLAEVSAQLVVLYGTAALLGQDPTYRPLRRGSAWARTQHALVGSVTAYRPDGSRVFAPGTFTGAVAASAVAKQLLPGTTMRAEIVSRGTSMLSNRVVRALWQEFL